ncbi:uncharacterized protein TrAFT101_002099 [Trichoderma asperellum]|uniref:MYND-type domain-containing protein n=1 Tax=Trichoderma asperellum (strain ATCC 204424 / CBS 433.97 / NBRC 101777) TaxID=1042311 RepID=A0A2T3ZFH1_TRIA4|nr:hypothetical protein M441DRAFT_189597 [Trichoderma asperellum CBS 433.97]PTB43540.1 hypothetical protein M441DRAFT_189597 [Trichoderma asperellum CBS 433.97]UKZ86263.1 hypothetical protein TrAFT101_002099 [Trichoderma asperellum]
MPLIMNVEDINDLDGLAPRACEVCHRKDKIFRCSACQAVYYCGRDCQVEDRECHKIPCKLLKKALDRYKLEEQKLREWPGDLDSPANAFEQDVGHFWRNMATRPYMVARLDLAHIMLNSYGTPGGPVDLVQIILDHYFDMLRLSRSDDLGVREIIPGLYVRLGRDQDAYDFMTWFAAVNEDPDHEWGNVDKPFLDTKDANVFEEPLKRAWTVTSFLDLSHAVVVLLIKVRVLLDLYAIQNTFIALTGVIPPEIIAIICGKLVRSDVMFRHQILLSTPEKMASLTKRIKSQVRELYKAVGKYNPYFWNLMVNDPDACVLRTPQYNGYAQRSEQEALVILAFTFAAWYETPGAIKMLRDLAKMR